MANPVHVVLDVLCAAATLAVGAAAGRRLFRLLRPRKPAFDFRNLPAAMDMRGATLANPATLAPTEQSRALYKKIKRQERIRALLHRLTR